MNPLRALPEGVEQIGLYRGQPIYRETVRTPIKEVQRDEEGRVLYHQDPKGNPIRTMPHTQIVGWEEEEREFMEVPLVNGLGEFTGTIQKNYHFREDTSHETAQVEREAIDADLREAAAVAREHGLTLKDVVAKLFEKPARKQKVEA